MSLRRAVTDCRVARREARSARPRRRPLARRLGIEPLEDRRLLSVGPLGQSAETDSDVAAAARREQSDLAEIHGSSFEDLDGDGVWDKDGPGAEPARPGVTVFLDLDQDGRLEAGEPSTVTAADGSYSFTGLAPGDYTVAELLDPGWVQTYPAPPNVLYAIGSGTGDGSSNFYRLENFAGSPAAFSIGESGVQLSDLAVDPTSGAIFAIRWDDGKLYELDPLTGAAVWRGAAGTPAQQSSLEFDAGGRLYAWGCNEYPNLYRVDKLTGARTLVGAVGYNGAGDMAFDVDGTLYGVSHDGSGTPSNLITIDTASGAGTLVGTLTVGGTPLENVAGLEIDADGTMYALRDTGTAEAELYLVDKATAECVLIGQIAGSAGFGAWGLAFARAASATGNGTTGSSTPSSGATGTYTSVAASALVSTAANDGNPAADATPGFDWTGWQAANQAAGDVVSGGAKSSDAQTAGLKEGGAAAGFTADIHYKFAGTPAIDASGTRAIVALDGEETWQSPGDPVLPVRSSTILLPQGQTVASVEVDFGEGRPLASGVQLVAAPGPIALTESGEIPLGIDTSEPQLAGSFLENDAVSWSTQMVCGYGIAMLNVFPVQYDAAAGRLTYYDDISLRVTTTPIDSPSVLPVRDSATDRARVAGMVDNDSVLSGYRATAGGGSEALPPGGPFEYAIITSSDLEGAFQPLLDQKLSRGLSATAVTTEYIYANYTGTENHDNADKIREFIADAYANWNTTWVLLGGDVDVVPYRRGYGFVPDGLALEGLGDTEYTKIATDLYFAALDGPWDYEGDGIWGESSDGSGGGDVDLVADVFIGRAPVGDVTETGHFVDKPILYETTPHPNQSRIVLLGERLDSQTYGSYSMIPIRNGTIPADWEIVEHYDSDGGWSTSTLIDDLDNNQPHVIHHLGHAYWDRVARLRNGDVAALTNPYPYFMYSQGCLAGKFPASDAVAEYHVKGEHGAFAVVMNSEYGWYLPGDVPDASHHWHYEFSDAMLNEGLIHLGQTNQDSKDDNLWRVGPIGAERWIHSELNLLGDPETPFQVSTAGKGVHSLSVGPGDVVENVGFGNRLNRLPTAGGDAFAVQEDSGTTRFDVLANDTTDPDPGEPLRITSVTTPSRGGTTEIVAGIRIDYTPGPDFAGTETFSYAVNDGNPGGDAAATVTVTVSPDANDPPVVANPLGDLAVDEDAADTTIELEPQDGPWVFDDPDLSLGDDLTYTAYAAPSVSDVVGEVSQEHYAAIHGNLLYTHTGDNRGNGPQHDLAQQNMVNYFDTLDLDPTLEPFVYNGATYYNVVATLPGTAGADSYYIVGAHYDSVNNPGADDNASGTAAVMEAARVLSQYDFEHTIKFIGFDREEQWLKGSYAYVTQHSGDDILGMVNLDMIAYNPAGTYQDKVRLYDGDGNSAEPRQIILDLDAAFDAHTTVVDAVDYNQWTNRSDHAPFDSAGYEAALIIEHQWGSNPYYHRSTDAVETPGYIDYAFATDVTRGVVGYVAGAALLSGGPLAAVSMSGSQLVLDYAEHQNGVTDVVVRATDLAGAWAEDTFRLTLNPLDDAPAVADPIPDVQIDPGDPDPVLNLWPHFSDPDLAPSGDWLKYSVVGNTNPALVTPAIDVDLDGNGQGYGTNLTLAYDQDQTGEARITVRAADRTQPDGLWVEDTFTVTVGDAGAAEVVDRHVFYNASTWDWEASADANGNGRFDPGEDGSLDDNAVAPHTPIADPADPTYPGDAAKQLGKDALLPGGTATFANYTSYSRGLNGIMIDVAGLAGTPTETDFLFKVGNNHDPGTWGDGPAPQSITVRAGAGTGSSDRVTLIWADDDPYTPQREPGSISKQWLQVSVLATAATGLAAPDLFYFGNAIGECGNSTLETNVDPNDEIGARNHTHSLFNPAPLEDAYDYDRDKKVDTNDEIIARNNSTSAFTRLVLLTAPSSAQDVASAAGPSAPESRSIRVGRAALHDAAFNNPGVAQAGVAEVASRVSGLPRLENAGRPDAQGRTSRIAAPARDAVEKLLATL